MQVISSLQQLSKDHIDLWSIDPTRLSDTSIHYLETTLSTNELDKLRQYKNKKAQHTALVTRSLCRLVLSQYTTVPASELAFIRNQHGKPELTDNEQNIRFNLSHNNELIIIAVCVKDDIGCDIENPSRKVNIEPITRRYFSKQEHAELSILRGEIQQKRFFEIWTLKEAFVKATGVGISLGLDTFYFDKSVLNNNISILFNVNYPRDQSEPWEFYQHPLSQQLIAICRSSRLKQSINFLDANKIITF